MACCVRNNSLSSEFFESNSFLLPRIGSVQVRMIVTLAAIQPAVCPIEVSFCTTKGVIGFYSGVSAVYFGTFKFGKSFLSKFDKYPSLLIPPTAGTKGNIVSSAITLPKELISQRMQAGAKATSWQVLLKILERDGVMGLYAGYSATLLRNLPAGVLSYSSFEYLKAAALRWTIKKPLEPIQSVFCGALAGAISASLITPLNAVKTRPMTQVHGKL